MMFLVAIAAPLDYMGIEVGDVFVYQGWAYDSLAGDPMHADSLVDTVTVDTSFDYGGFYAVRMRGVDHFVLGDSTQTEADTAYNDSPWVRVMVDVAEVPVESYAYRTPLSVGDSWSRGLAGTYFMDVDNDGVPDSVMIRCDTTYVEAQEDVGIWSGAYRLYIKSTAWFLSSSYSDSGIITSDRWEWWVPGLGMVRDTVHQVWTVYYSGTFPIIIRTQTRWDMLTWTNRVLEELETEGIPLQVLPWGLANPGNEPLGVYRTDGRRVAVLPPGGSLRLPRGVYLVRGAGGSRVAAIGGR